MKETMLNRFATTTLCEDQHRRIFSLIPKFRRNSRWCNNVNTTHGKLVWKRHYKEINFNLEQSLKPNFANDSRIQFYPPQFLSSSQLLPRPGSRSFLKFWNVPADLTPVACSHVLSHPLFRLPFWSTVGETATFRETFNGSPVLFSSGERDR